MDRFSGYGDESFILTFSAGVVTNDVVKLFLRKVGSYVVFGSRLFAFLAASLAALFKRAPCFCFAIFKAG